MSGEIPRETLEAVNEALSEQMGLRFPENRLRDLERGLVVACRELGLAGPDQCVSALRGAKLSREQVERLAAQLTVGETYFFREPKSFRILEEKLLPELIERRRSHTRILRFWSAGCSSGEEAYSIAILLQRLIPDWRDWGIIILATDINPDAVRKAEEGVYGEWSFRGLGVEFKERYFTPAGKKRYRIKNEVREMVRFSYLNLAEEGSYPSLATNTLAMDVIFCRNVLMYFSREMIGIVTHRFWESLTDGGWVLTSPSEASAHYFQKFETVNFPGAIFFRKAGGPATRQEPRATGLRRVEEGRLSGLSSRPAAGTCRLPSAEPERASRRGREQETARQLRKGDKPAATEKDRGRELGLVGLDLLARARANTGNLPEALVCCERALSLDPLAVQFHYLKAGILQEMGESEQAAAALRKALFLKRDFAMAHFTLGSILRQWGSRPEARRHFRRAQELFSNMHPDDSPVEGEGINAARLGQMAAANLRSLT